MSDACVAQWLEHLTGNRKTWTLIPAPSKASFFPQKDLKFFKFEFNLHLCAILVFEIVYENSCRQRILSDTRLIILR